MTQSKSKFAGVYDIKQRRRFRNKPLILRHEPIELDDTAVISDIRLKNERFRERQYILRMAGLIK